METRDKMKRDSLFGKIPENWSLKEIGDVITLKQGLQISKKLRVQKEESGSVPLLKITDLPTRNYSEYVINVPSGYIANPEDIIYTRTGQVGLVYTDINGCVHNNCFKVIANDKLELSKNYIYYYLNNSRFREYANSIASGSVQKDLTHTSFKKILIAYPDLETQEKIASILSALDDKIEINNEMNKTLEEMAQTLFKRWFIDFDFPNENGEPYRSSGGKMVDSELGEIPEGWEVSNLGDLFKFVKGKKPKIVSENFSEETPLKYLTIKGFNGDENLYASEDKTILINKKDIVMVMDGASSGDVYIGKSGVLGSTFSKIEKIKEIDWSYIYLILKYYEGDIKSHTTGSAIPHTDKGYVEKIRVSLPNLELLNILSKKISGIIKRKLINQEEIQSLTEIRDILLPKLMSGEVEV